ncbi:MAG TPA: MFS transporter [Candidatus Paceibacterota bacterium]
MDKLLLPFRQSKLLNTLFISNVFISLHYAMIIYVNSSYLSNFFSETQVSALYIIGSIINTILLLNASRILEKVGIYKFTMATVILELLATLGMALSSTPFFVGLYFLIHLNIIALLLFNMDIYVENISKNNALTGSVRATYLTMTNVTIIVAPSIVALLLLGNKYLYVYAISCLCIIPAYYYTKKFKAVVTRKVHHINIKNTIAEYVKNRDLYNIFTAGFLLQLFYAYMVVYTPIYLNKYIGFSWPEIGVMFTIMLVPFVLFEMPVGELEDYKYGEKEFLTIGFVIMGLATIFMSFITLKVFWIWAVVLFITRIGASLVEVSTESYFWKLVHPDKTDVIGFFRINRPISFMVAPLLATLTFQFIPFQYIFIVVGSIMILGTKYSLSLNDTK